MIMNEQFQRQARALPWLLAAGLAASLSSPSHAQAWPSKTVRVIIPAAPGGSSDPLARIVAEELARVHGGSFIVENRPGANGNIGAAMVAKAEPDGHTLLVSWTGTLVSAVTMYGAKPFHPQKDFEPIVLVGSIPNVITVAAPFPANTFAEFTEYARKNPGKINFGSTGSGSSWHLSAELYKKTLGVSMVHVPYNSPGAVTTDLIGGQLQAAFPGATAIAGMVKDRRLKAIAVMADKRSQVLPDTPTTRELGYPQLESSTWIALLAPKGTPADITQKINATLNAALASPGFRNRLIGMGYTPLGGSSAEFAAYMDAEIHKWGEIVKFSGAKID